MLQIKTETRDKTVKFRVTKKELEYLVASAKKQERNLSEYIRDMLLCEKPDNKRKLERLDKRMAELVYQVRKIGVNINQIAHNCNAAGIRSGDLKDAKRWAEESEKQVQRGIEDIAQYIQSCQKGSERNGSHETDVPENGKEGESLPTPGELS